MLDHSLQQVQLKSRNLNGSFGHKNVYGCENKIVWHYNSESAQDSGVHPTTAFEYSSALVGHQITFVK